MFQVIFVDFYVFNITLMGFLMNVITNGTRKLNALLWEGCNDLYKLNNGLDNRLSSRGKRFSSAYNLIILHIWLHNWSSNQKTDHNEFASLKRTQAHFIHWYQERIFWGINDFVRETQNEHKLISWDLINFGFRGDFISYRRSFSCGAFFSEHFREKIYSRPWILILIRA